MTQTKLFRIRKPKENTNSLTIACINYLRLKGFFVWRQNSLGVWDAKKGIYRKNPYNVKGISDILGFHLQTGVVIACEIKTGSDKLSPEQKVFLEQVNKAGGIGLEVRSLDDLVKAINTTILHEQAKNP